MGAMTSSFAPPQWVLLASLVCYPALYRVSLPRAPSFARIVQSREAISLFHCILQTLLSAACLGRHRRVFAAPSTHGRLHSAPPLIATRSSFAQCITALETGYLLQDTLVLLHARRVRQSAASNSTVPAPPVLKAWNLTHLFIHHVILGAAFSLLQYYIARGRDKGTLIVATLHLMNVSSVFGTLRWMLLNFHPHYQRTILAVTAAYVASFACFRVYLLLWILQLYGKQRGPSVLTALAHLPSPCKLGSAAIILVNIYWLANITRKLLLRVSHRKKMT